MRSRRGLSSVVGMVFAIVAIITAMGYVSYSLNTLNQFNTATLTRNQQSINAGEEGLQLYTLSIVNGKFNITVANTGPLPINVTRMWIQNTTASDWTNYYSINKLVTPGNFLTNIGQSSPVGDNPSYAYNIKLVTGRGNNLQFTLGSPGVKPLFMQAMFVPNAFVEPSPAVTTNATLLFEVTNNMTSNNLITNLSPNSPYCFGTLNTFSLISGPLPANYRVLSSGSIAIFKWVYSVENTGSSTERERCTVTLANGVAGNNGTDYLFSP